MQVSNIISDLSMLLSSDNKVAAQRLISARPPATAPDLAKSRAQRRRSSVLVTGAEHAKDDVDLARAYKLLELHRDVKLAYDGQSNESSALRDLQEARQAVDRAMRRLGSESDVTSSRQAAHQGSKLDGAGNEGAVLEEAAAGEDDDDDVSAWA